jgi:hypothetical protein
MCVLTKDLQRTGVNVYANKGLSRKSRIVFALEELPFCAHVRCVADGARAFAFADTVRSAAALRRLKDAAALRHSEKVAVPSFFLLYVFLKSFLSVSTFGAFSLVFPDS